MSTTTRRLMNQRWNMFVTHAIYILQRTKQRRYYNTQCDNMIVVGWDTTAVTQDVLCHLLAVQNMDLIHAQKKALTQENIIENTKASHYMQQVSRDAQDV